MKKLFFFALAALAFTACSDDDSNPTPKNICTANHTSVISFEQSEGLADIEGVAVVPGDITVVGSTAGGTFHHVFWPKSISNFESYLKADEYGGQFYDGYLCSTADENVWFGSYYSVSSFGDFWAGFTLTGNYGKNPKPENYNQFTVWADKGANGTSQCLVAYDAFMSGYARPTIEFATTPMAVCHCYLANTAIAYNYAPTVVEADKYYYKVVITGWLGDVETGRAECVLVNGTSRVADWTKVDLSALGKVDKLTFFADSNEANEYGLLAPAYFALDEIGFVADK